MYRPLVVAALALLYFAPSAQASPYISDYYSGYRNYTNGRPPYFAEFPPVYYSWPVARPYGLYPYAHMARPDGYAIPVPAHLQQPKPQPTTVVNPYVTPDGAERTTAKRGQPQVILNPYVEQNLAEQSPLRGAQPQIVRPAEQFGAE